MNINEQCFQGKTALLLAAEAGSVESASMLITHGADLDLRDNMDTTPLIAGKVFSSVEMSLMLMMYLQRNGKVTHSYHCVVFRMCHAKDYLLFQLLLVAISA